MGKIAKLNIKSLLENDAYLIPLYQRNYAWGREEVQQLLKDINETAGNYYLGTLVVAKNTNNQYEIIDGQQRHTTLSIINAVLKYKGHEAVKVRNLFFEAREKSETIIDNLLLSNDSYNKAKHMPNEDKGVLNIVNAAQDVEDFLFDKCKTLEAARKFVSRFYNEIVIYRVELPENTDLNHYFEIMNNRGEQLEEHEILKAAFLSKPEVEDEEKQHLFSKIWDACSQMNCHVQFCFPSDDRTSLFGESYQNIPSRQTLESFLSKREAERLAVINQFGTVVKDDNSSLKSIIENYNLSAAFDQNKSEEFIEKYSSIIDFPNFLLQVLKLQDDSVSLDDKLLLPQFGYPNHLPNAWEFILNLLRYRVLFDRYIIKREGDTSVWNWSLKMPSKANDYQSTFHEGSDDDFRRKLRMIQSMFQVTFPSNNYKNWLFETMKVISFVENCQIPAQLLLSEMEKQAANYYRLNQLENFFRSGLHTPRFLFNYLDYLLWCKYSDHIRGDNKNLPTEEGNTYLGVIKKEKEKFNGFKFVQRSSIEHLFPQSRSKEIDAENDEERNTLLNSFGNLCLISRSSNSAYNNDLPFQKKHDSKSKNESLKQIIMFGSFSGDTWNSLEIRQHESEMKDLLTEISENYDQPNQ